MLSDPFFFFCNPCRVWSGSSHPFHTLKTDAVEPLNIFTCLDREPCRPRPAPLQLYVGSRTALGSPVAFVRSSGPETNVPDRMTSRFEPLQASDLIGQSISSCLHSHSVPGFDPPEVRTKPVKYGNNRTHARPAEPVLHGPKHPPIEVGTTSIIRVSTVRT